MRLTARSEYGLLALLDLASGYGGGPVSVREVAQRQDIPIKFLEQLFVALRKAGLVTAKRGAHGGFVLCRAPGSITVLEVVEALEGPLGQTLCAADGTCTKLGACAAASVWERASRALRQVFAGTTLAELCGAAESSQGHSSGRDASAKDASCRV